MKLPEPRRLEKAIEEEIKTSIREGASTAHVPALIIQVACPTHAPLMLHSCSTHDPHVPALSMQTRARSIYDAMAAPHPCNGRPFVSGVRRSTRSRIPNRARRSSWR